MRTISIIFFLVTGCIFAQSPHRVNLIDTQGNKYPESKIIYTEDGLITIISQKVIYNIDIEKFDVASREILGWTPEKIYEIKAKRDLKFALEKQKIEQVKFIEFLTVSGSWPEIKKFVDSVGFDNVDPRLQKRYIDLDVAESAVQTHEILPPATFVRHEPGAANATIKIENDTIYKLTVSYSGANSYRFTFDPKTSQSYMLAPGSYRVLASVDSASVSKYVGSEDLARATYDVKFYIRSQSYSIPVINTN